MNRTLAILAGVVLLACAGLLIIDARESEEVARARTTACTAPAVAEARRQSAILGIQIPASVGHCTFEQRWDMQQVALGGIALAGALGLFAFGAARRPATG